MDTQSLLKKLPSVERVLESDRIAAHLNLLSKRGVTRIVRDTISRYRRRILEGEGVALGSDTAAARKPALSDSIIDDVAGELEVLSGARLARVINATGVVLHTNLGRAVLGEEVCRAIVEAASGYADLEVDLTTGARVERGRRVKRLIALLTGAEDALVVNNNAAAVLLAVDTFAAAGGVAISRGELVEIGGSFRLPEILAKAAGSVVEVGTTNRTHLGDYEHAITEGASLLLKVHTSNYRIVGYTNEVSLDDLARLGKKHGVPVMYDQGNGMLYPLDRMGVRGEESVESILDKGIDLVSFSTDKVLGAPQGGIVAGSGKFVARMRGNHLSRALRVDKLTLAGLERVLLQYWRGEIDAIPALGMISMNHDVLRERAEGFAARLEPEAIKTGATVRTAGGESAIGGGSYPVTPIETVLVEIALDAGGADRLARRLRAAAPPVMVRVREDSVFIDLRTVLRSQEADLEHAVVAALAAT
jgi:L-seryl-tRNA(Ser) seleniumtransferase